MVRCAHLHDLCLTETTGGGSDLDSGWGRDNPRATCGGLVACLALPDADCGSLHRGFTAEHAVVSCVLGDFHLLHHLTEGSTITGTVLSDDAGLLGTLGHCEV